MSNRLFVIALRDQIKTWIASNDIKDKQVLVDKRKLIETVSLESLLCLQRAFAKPLFTCSNSSNNVLKTL